MRSARSGVTIIEILLVVALTAIIGMSASPFLSNFILRNSIEVTTDQLVGSFRKAQLYAMDGKNSATWGVCLTGNAMRVFASTCASPTFSEQFTIAPGVTVTGLSTVTFDSQRGEPSSTPTITLTTAIGSKSVTLNSAGGIDIN